MKLPALTIAALAFVACASAATGPKVALTTGGNAAAKATLITLSDLGKGWTSKAAQTGGLQVACSGYEPSFKGIVETGAAGSPAFSAGTVGPFFSQITSVYASARQASTLWSRAVQAGLITCVADSVKAIGAAGQGVKVKITSRQALPIQKATSLESAYRVIATLSSAKVKYKRTVYFDVVLVGKGSTITELTFSAFQAPVPAKVEAALGALAAHRIGLPTA